MKGKYLYLSTIGCILSISGGNAQSVTPATKPHPWVAEIVSNITKYGQSEACANNRNIRRNHNNCATYDGAAIAKIVCGTHDHVYRKDFDKGQCGTKSVKAFGGVTDVGEYFEKAIDQRKPDAIALACTPPLEQLRGKLREVAMKKCRVLGTPATRIESKTIAEEAVLAREKLIQVPLKDSPFAKNVYDAIKSLHNNKITDNMAISAANMIANVPKGVKPITKVKTAVSMLGDLTTGEKEAAETVIKSALQPIPSGGVSPVTSPQPFSTSPSGLEDTPVAKAVYSSIAALRNDKVTEKMAVKASNVASDRPGGLFGKASAALNELKLTGDDQEKANTAIKAALREIEIK